MTSVYNEEILKPGEDMTRRYLEQEKLTFEKGFSLGKKVIDFRIETALGDILLENADLEECDLDRGAEKAAIQSFLQFEDRFKPGYVKRLKQRLEVLSEKNPDGKDKVIASSAGAWDPFKRPQQIIKDKSDQLKAAKGLHPNVVALFNAGSIPNEFDLHMRIGLGNDRYFSAGRNTTVSALAILETVGGRVSMRIYHNPYAAKPLPLGSFPNAVEFTKENLWDSEIIPLA